jgi:deoxyribodipyrimidine photo-lyase
MAACSAASAGSYSVVWFKRDLRLHDHAPLLEAARRGSVLCLYVVEPQLWQQPDSSSQHYGFISESLRDLAASLHKRGVQLLVRVGHVTQVLQQLHQAAPFHALFSHQETGNAFTYQRDIAVADWCSQNQVQWHEYAQTGVIRRLRTRDAWARRWESFMGQPVLAVPHLNPARLPLDAQPLPLARDLQISVFDPPERQRGGRRRGIDVLLGFLLERSSQYRGGISSPLSAPQACSRLSPYLSYGCLGMREVVQATRRQLQAVPAGDRRRQGLQGFIKRLHWHCHFMQKLESEPEIEWRNMHRGYDGLREDQFDHQRFQALTEGRTGWPMVDACVAMLNHTGWLNFRMRAMLVSVAAYPLWLHWRPVGLWLARAFLDYEPGIHWSQLQMQSGTTGINTTRVYNPVKQAADHDPAGVFVRRWLPAMRSVPNAWLFEPWRMPDTLRQQHGLTQAMACAQPLVDLDCATRQAKQWLHARRAQPQVRAAKQQVLQRHGSRQKGGKSSRRPASGADDQLTLPL